MSAVRSIDYRWNNQSIASLRRSCGSLAFGIWTRKRISTTQALVRAKYLACQMKRESLQVRLTMFPALKSHQGSERHEFSAMNTRA